MMEERNLSRGFTLIESLLALLVMTIIVYISFSFKNVVLEKYQAKLVLLKLTSQQYQAFFNKEKVCLNDDFINSKPCFNGAGNVNQAQTLILKGISNYKIIINLGAGKHYLK